MNIEKEYKNKPEVKELKVLERDNQGFPSLMYSRSKMTMMSEREAVLRLQKFR